MKYLYIIYQYLIAWPIIIVLTMLCAILTILFCPWRNSEFVHKFQQVWARSFCRLMFLPVMVDGTENIVPGQSYVFVANHQSMYDVWVVYGWLPVIFKWLMKAELRKVPFVGIGCKAAGHIFVERRSVRASVESLKQVAEQLTGGVCTVIFPEGTRSKTGELGKFKRGAFQIALDLNLPVVPISLSGCYEAMRPGAKYVTRHPMHMHIGKPIDLKQFDDPAAAIEAARTAVASGITH